MDVCTERTEERQTQAGAFLCNQSRRSTGSTASGGKQPVRQSAWAAPADNRASCHVRHAVHGRMLLHQATESAAPGNGICCTRQRNSDPISPPAAVLQECIQTA